MKNDKIVKTVIDGSEVEGIITDRSSRYIGIRIEKPYQNISGGCSIPYFMISLGSFDGDDGDYEAKRILEELFSTGKYMDENLGDLKEKLTCVKDRISGLAAQMMGDDRYHEEKRQLKIRFKKGDIENKEYGQKLRALKKELKQFEFASRTCMDPFFEQFPVTVPGRTKEEVLDIIEGKKSLISTLSSPL